MSRSQPRILVTGGAGFIGSALVWALNQRGVSEIVITDFLGKDERWRNLAGLEFADCLDAGQFRRRVGEAPNAFGRFTHVFHLGACSSTTEADAAYLLDNNFEVTKELARWALGQEARFVYASSAATYGDGRLGMDDGGDVGPLRPLNMYGYSKQLFDLHARRQGWAERIVGLKYFNVFGPNEDHKGDMRSLVHKSYQEIMRSGKISLFKSHRPEYAHGEQKRDFLYVKDAVEMTLHLGMEAGVPGGLYNLGSGEANSWNALAGAIFAALGRPPVIEYVDMPEVLRGKYQYFTQANIAKLHGTGYARPLTPLAEAVKDYVQNYLRPDRRLETSAGG